MSETKVTAHPYKSFGQAFSKACRVEGQRPRRSRRSETPQRILTNETKVTVKPSKRKNKKRNAAQKVGMTDVMIVTI